jgi:hypothetical protein
MSSFAKIKRVGQQEVLIHIQRSARTALAQIADEPKRLNNSGADTSATYPDFCDAPPGQRAGTTTSLSVLLMRWPGRNCLPMQM